MIQLESLFTEFDDAAIAPATWPIAASGLPEPYRDLLVHAEHMTVTVERFHADAVDVEVLHAERHGAIYRRRILLRLRRSRQVVQFGLVEVNLDCLPTEAAEEILGGCTPLGRVLIEHDVLRIIEPVGYFRTHWPQIWSVTPTIETYGRLGIIWSHGKQAVRVAEILTPINFRQNEPKA